MIATSTALVSLVNWTQVVATVFGSGVVAAIIALFGQKYFFDENRMIRRREILYGPLRFYLDMINHLEKNRQEIEEKDIPKYSDVNTRIQKRREYIGPINKKINKHWDDIFNLLKEHSGQIDPAHYDLTNNFIDGYLKREMIENGRNDLAEEDERITKILNATKKLREAVIKIRS